VFDFRVRTPNTQLLSPKVTHSLEHLFAVALRTEFEEHQRDLSVIDVSPMGCRTGFYLTILNPRGTLPLGRIAASIRSMLDIALEIESLPGARRETCGAFEEHDLEGARSEIRRLVGESIVQLDKPPCWGLNKRRSDTC
jgi:S-ribosylhomocysteine lyase